MKNARALVADCGRTGRKRAWEREWDIEEESVPSWQVSQSGCEMVGMRVVGARLWARKYEGGGMTGAM